MARNLREVIAAVRAERRAKIAAAYRQKLIAKKKKRQLEEAKRVIELDRNLIAIAVIITALPIIAALAWMLTALAVGDGGSLAPATWRYSPRSFAAILRASSLLSSLAAERRPGSSS